MREHRGDQETAVSRWILTGLILMGLAFGANDAHANALLIADSGILDISNQTGTLIGLTTDPSSCINFGGGGTCAGTTHTMLVSGISNLFFPSTGTIKDFSLAPVTFFEMVTGVGLELGNTINFDLTSILKNGPTTNGICAGAIADQALNTCTPANAPFTLSEDITGKQVTIQFAALLNAYTGASTTGVTPYEGLFTLQESGVLAGSGACAGLTANITNILTCEAGGGTIVSTWSASESPVSTSTTTTPEPTYVFFIGSGFFSLILARHFRRRQERN